MQLKIVFTGPESSGKTTLATTMARETGGALVSEFARPFLNALDRPYEYADLKTIARGQQAWETWRQDNSKAPILFCDTDWTVIYVWEQFKFGATDLFADQLPPAADHYFLCAPDIPWRPDPLREHPTSRDELFRLYEQLLKNTGASYTILNGNLTQRLEMIRSVIRKLM